MVRSSNLSRGHRRGHTGTPKRTKSSQATNNIAQVDNSLSRCLRKSPGILHMNHCTWGIGTLFTQFPVSGLTTVQSSRGHRKSSNSSTKAGVSFVLKNSGQAIHPWDTLWAATATIVHYLSVCVVRALTVDLYRDVRCGLSWTNIYVKGRF